MTDVTLGRRLIDINMRWSRVTARALRLPTDKTLWERWQQTAESEIRHLPDGSTVVDLGAGRRCIYAGALRSGVELVAIDSSAEELALNDHADIKIVADASNPLPVPPGSADLLVSRAVLEHVPDMRAAAGAMAGVLRPGGRTVHIMSARYSLFGIAARVLPFKPLLWLLHRVDPTTIDHVEFDVFYDRAWPAAIESTFKEAGFRTVDVEVTWAQPGYFEPFYPLFLVYALYEQVVRRLRLRRLASYLLITAER
jgi:SAM-dependent methyltransferase